MYLIRALGHLVPRFLSERANGAHILQQLNAISYAQFVCISCTSSEEKFWNNFLSCVHPSPLTMYLIWGKILKQLPVLCHPSPCAVTSVRILLLLWECVNYPSPPHCPLSPERTVQSQLVIQSCELPPLSHCPPSTCPQTVQSQLVRTTPPPTLSSIPISPHFWVSQISWVVVNLWER